MITTEYFKTDLTNTERVSRQMFLIESLRHIHVSKELAQATVETSIITGDLYAVTICGQTWTSGYAYEQSELGNTRLKFCKACATKTAK